LFVPAPIEVLGRFPELDDKVAGEVLRFRLAPFLAPQTDKCRLIGAHDDPRIRAADE
jgi:hypothetical protein